MLLPVESVNASTEWSSSELRLMPQMNMYGSEAPVLSVRLPLLRVPLYALVHCVVDAEVTYESVTPQPRMVD